jgi:hypothetical protein
MSKTGHGSIHRLVPYRLTEVYQNLLPFYCLQRKITSIKVTECFSEILSISIISCKYNCIILATSILFEKFLRVRQFHLPLQLPYHEHIHNLMTKIAINLRWSYSFLTILCNGLYIVLFAPKRFIKVLRT